MVRRDPRGSLMVEMVVALAILTTALVPLAYSFVVEQRQCRAAYVRAVAMEIVDGEMELLVAGEWRSFGDGTHPYSTRALAATNLPPGKLTLTVRDRHLRLEWRPDVPRHGRVIIREAVGR